MRRWWVLFFFIFMAAHAATLYAEEPEPQQAFGQEAPLPVSGAVPPQNPPRLRGRELVLDINARVVEQNQTVIWAESHKKNTIPGHPVGIKIVGANIVVIAQFTPYIRHRGLQKLLVAQGQIWMEIPGQGIRYQTSMQTMPLEFGEPIYYFPLGPQTDEDSSRIEVMLTLYPYEEDQ
ncbi:MAG: hypothetical protein LBG95_08790 [Treponema sp.]|jgi:hypothetical protein|nr:hypothetical protein [Treponema sp.]